MRGKPCCGWVGLGGGFPIGNMPCACCLYPRAAEAPALPQQNKAQSDRRRKGAVSPLCAYRTSAGTPPPVSCLPQRVISSSPHPSQSPLTPYGRITAGPVTPLLKDAANSRLRALTGVFVTTERCFSA